MNKKGENRIWIVNITKYIGGGKRKREIRGTTRNKDKGSVRRRYKLQVPGTVGMIGTSFIR